MRRSPRIRVDRFPPYQGPDWDRKISNPDNPHFWKFGVADLVFLGYVRGKSTVLDLGCGTGGSALFLAENLDAEWIVGVDLIKDMIKVAKKNAANKGFDRICFLVCDGRNLPFQASCFEALVSRGDAFCFLVPLKKAVQELKRIMKLDGVVVLEMDNRADWKPGTTLSTGFRRMPDGQTAYVVETFTARRNHRTISYVLDSRGKTASMIVHDHEFQEKGIKSQAFPLQEIKKEAVEIRQGTETHWPTAKELHTLFKKAGFAEVQVSGDGLLMNLLLKGDRTIVEVMKRDPSIFFEIERRLVPYVDPDKAPTMILRATVS
jgi:ubiquinone/menaquinone biosynthesis C-methylase UbiE